MNMTKILLGFEVATGNEVNIGNSEKVLLKILSVIKQEGEIYKWFDE